MIRQILFHHDKHRTFYAYGEAVSLLLMTILFGKAYGLVGYLLAGIFLVSQVLEDIVAPTLQRLILYVHYRNLEEPHRKLHARMRVHFQRRLSENGFVAAEELFATHLADLAPDSIGSWRRLDDRLLQRARMVEAMHLYLVPYDDSPYEQLGDLDDKLTEIGIAIQTYWTMAQCHPHNYRLLDMKLPTHRLAESLREMENKRYREDIDKRYPKVDEDVPAQS